MRLAQLARKLNEKTYTVREALSEKFDIDFEKGPNTKLLDEHVTYLEERFSISSPKSNESTEEEKTTSNDTVENQVDIDEVEDPTPKHPEQVEVEEIVEEPVIQTVGEVVGNVELDPEAINPEEAELIKAPKVKLEGIKVVDKIDLPEPKEKEAEVPPEDKPQPKAKQKNRKKGRRPSSPHKSKEKVQAEKKKSEPVNRGPSMQELKRQKFEESYNPKPKQIKKKKKKSSNKKVVQEQPLQQPEIISNPKKTALGKFWWWLTNG